MVDAIHNGIAPIPAAKPVSASVPAPEPLSPTQTVFMIKSAKYRDHDGHSRCVGQFEDADMPVATAQRALRLRAAVTSVRARPMSSISTPSRSKNPWRTFRCRAQPTSR